MIVIDENGDNLGQMSRDQALMMSRDKGLDLVEINPTNRPPICKIMDFGKHKYDLAKKEKENRSKQKTHELKEIRITFKISDHDISYKAKQAKDFFDSGDQVKVSMRLRGRENAFFGQAIEVFNKFAQVAGLEYDKMPQKSGNTINANLVAIKNKENKDTPNEVKDAQSNPEKN